MRPETGRKNKTKQTIISIDPKVTNQAIRKSILEGCKTLPVVKVRNILLDNDICQKYFKKSSPKAKPEEMSSKFDHKVVKKKRCRQKESSKEPDVSVQPTEALIQVSPEPPIKVLAECSVSAHSKLELPELPVHSSSQLSSKSVSVPSVESLIDVPVQISEELPSEPSVKGELYKISLKVKQRRRNNAIWLYKRRRKSNPSKKSLMNAVLKNDQKCNSKSSKVKFMTGKLRRSSRNLAEEKHLSRKDETLIQLPEQAPNLASSVQSTVQLQDQLPSLTSEPLVQIPSKPLEALMDSEPLVESPLESSMQLSSEIQVQALVVQPRTPNQDQLMRNNNCEINKFKSLKVMRKKVKSLMDPVSQKDIHQKYDSTSSKVKFKKEKPRRGVRNLKEKKPLSSKDDTLIQHPEQAPNVVSSIQSTAQFQDMPMLDADICQKNCLKLDSTRLTVPETLVQPLEQMSSKDSVESPLEASVQLSSEVQAVKPPTQIQDQVMRDNNCEINKFKSLRVMQKKEKSLMDPVSQKDIHQKYDSTLSKVKFKKEKPRRGVRNLKEKKPLSSKDDTLIQHPEQAPNFVSSIQSTAQFQDMPMLDADICQKNCLKLDSTRLTVPETLVQPLEQMSSKDSVESPLEASVQLSSEVQAVKPPTQIQDQVMRDNNCEINEFNKKPLKLVLKKKRSKYNGWELRKTKTPSKISLMDPVLQEDIHQKCNSTSSKMETEKPHQSGRNLEEKLLGTLKIDSLIQLPEQAPNLASSLQSPTQLQNQPMADVDICPKNVLNLELPSSTSEPLVQLPLKPLVESPLESSDTRDELIPLDSQKNGNGGILKKKNTVGRRIKPKIEEHCRNSSNLEEKSLSLNVETSIQLSKQASNLTSFVKSPTHLQIQDELNESKGNRKRKSGKHDLHLKRKKIVSSSIESLLEPELDKDIQVTSTEPILAPVFNTEHRIELPIDSPPVQPPIQSPLEPPIQSPLEPPIQPPLEPTIQPTIKPVDKIIPIIKVSFSKDKRLLNGQEISFNKYNLEEFNSVNNCDSVNNLNDCETVTTPIMANRNCDKHTFNNNVTVNTDSDFFTESEQFYEEFETETNNSIYDDPTKEEESQIHDDESFTDLETNYNNGEVDKNKYKFYRRWNASLATFIEPEIDSNYYIYKNALSTCFYIPKINNVNGATLDNSLYKSPTKSDKSIKSESPANRLNSSLSNLTSPNLPDEVIEEPESDEREFDKQSLKHESISCQISEKSEITSNSINESPLKENELHLLDREHVVTNVKIKKTPDSRNVEFIEITADSELDYESEDIESSDKMEKSNNILSESNNDEYVTKTEPKPILDNTHSKTNNLGIIPISSIKTHYPNSYFCKKPIETKDTDNVRNKNSTKLNYQPKDNSLFNPRDKVRRSFQDRLAKCRLIPKSEDEQPVSTNDNKKQEETNCFKNNILNTSSEILNKKSDIHILPNSNSIFTITNSFVSIPQTVINNLQSTIEETEVKHNENDGNSTNIACTETVSSPRQDLLVSPVRKVFFDNFKIPNVQPERNKNIPENDDLRLYIERKNNSKEDQTKKEQDSDVLSLYASTLNDELDTYVSELNVNLEPPKEYSKRAVELWCESVSILQQSDLADNPDNLLDSEDDKNFETDFDLRNRKCYWAVKNIRQICKSFGDCQNKCGRKHFIHHQFNTDISSFNKEDLDVFYEHFIPNININVIKVLFPLVVNRYSELKEAKKLVRIVADVLKFNTKKSCLIKMIIDGLQKCDSIEYHFEKAVNYILLNYGMQNLELSNILLDLIIKESAFLKKHWALIRELVKFRYPKINPTITEHIIEVMLKCDDFVKGNYEIFYKDFFNKDCVNLKAIKKSLFTKLLKKMEENKLFEYAFSLSRDYYTNNGEKDQDLDAEDENFMDKSNEGGLFVPPVDENLSDFDMKDLKSFQISLEGDPKLFENLLLKYRGEIVKEFFIAQLIVFLKGANRMNVFTDMFLMLLDKYKYTFVEDKVLENMFMSVAFNTLPWYEILKDYPGATRIILSFYNNMDSFLRTKCLWTVEPFCHSLRNDQEKLVFIIKFLNKTYELDKSIKLIMHEKFNLGDDNDPRLFHYKTLKIDECIRKCFEIGYLRSLKILIYHLIPYDSIQKEINVKVYYNRYLLRIINSGLNIPDLIEQFNHEISKHFELLDLNILRGLLVVLFQNNVSIHMLYKGFEICEEKHWYPNRESLHYLYLYSQLTNTEIKLHIYMFFLRMLNRNEVPVDIEIHFWNRRGSTNSTFMPNILLESLQYTGNVEEVKSRVITVLLEMKVSYRVSQCTIKVKSESVKIIMEQLRRTAPVIS